jgi:hypothetical protein
MSRLEDVAVFYLGRWGKSPCLSSLAGQFQRLALPGHLSSLQVCAVLQPWSVLSGAQLPVCHDQGRAVIADHL